MKKTRKSTPKTSKTPARRKTAKAVKATKAAKVTKTAKAAKPARSLKSINAKTIKPYSELRQDFFAIGDAAASRGKVPTRPAKLDTRLPADGLKNLALFGHKDNAKATKGFGAYIAVLDSIRAELAKLDEDNEWYELLSPARSQVVLADAVESEVNNGGFDQYFLNSSGDGAYLAPDALRALGLRDLAKMVESANAKFPKGPSPAREARLAQMEKLPESVSVAWNKLDDKFFDRKPPTVAEVCVKFITANPSEFFKV